MSSNNAIPKNEMPVVFERMGPTDKDISGGLSVSELNGMDAVDALLGASARSVVNEALDSYQKIFSTKNLITAGLATAAVVALFATCKTSASRVAFAGTLGLAAFLAGCSDEEDQSSFYLFYGPVYGEISLADAQLILPGEAEEMITAYSDFNSDEDVDIFIGATGASGRTSLMSDQN